MAADDEFPRGLTLTAYEPNTTPASVTFPATTGIAWVLTAVDAIMATGNATTTAGAIANVTTGVGVTGIVFNQLTTGEASGDEWSWSGKAPGAVGAALTVAFSTASGGGNAQWLTATAYPI